MLKAIAYDPATTTKRLGDGFYEHVINENQWGQTPLISFFKHKYNVQTLLITAAN
ncbi:MAG: hypothetical protein WCG35_07745 [Betaproteobacteria bacterium]